MWDGYLADRERVAWANSDVVFSDQAAKSFVLLVAKPFETRVLNTFVVRPEGAGVSALSEL